MPPPPKPRPPPPPEPLFPELALPNPFPPPFPLPPPLLFPFPLEPVPEPLAPLPLFADEPDEPSEPFPLERSLGRSPVSVRTRPLVTFWKSTFTSPSACLIAIGCAARPFERAGPSLGTAEGTLGARGCPSLIWFKIPVPLRDRPGAPSPSTRAIWPGSTSAICPDRRSATSTWPEITSTLLPARSTETWNCVPFTTATR